MNRKSIIYKRNRIREVHEYKGKLTLSLWHPVLWWHPLVLHTEQMQNFFLSLRSLSSHKVQSASPNPWSLYDVDQS